MKAVLALSRWMRKRSEVRLRNMRTGANGTWARASAARTLLLATLNFVPFESDTSHMSSRSSRRRWRTPRAT